MENFWENVLAAGFFLLKIGVALLIIRVVLFFVGYNMYIPYLDDFVYFVLRQVRQVF